MYHLRMISRITFCLVGWFGLLLLLLLFCQAEWLLGSQFLNQGWNLGPLK